MKTHIRKRKSLIDHQLAKAFALFVIEMSLWVVEQRNAHA